MLKMSSKTRYTIKLLSKLCLTIAFACVMEYGYSGSGSAGYVAKAVLEEYFALNQPLQNTDPVAGTVVQ